MEHFIGLEGENDVECLLCKVRVAPQLKSMTIHLKIVHGKPQSAVTRERLLGARERLFSET